MPIRTQLIVSAVVVVIGFGAGWMVNGWRLNAALSSAQAAHAQELEQLAQATVASVQAVRAEEARRRAAVEEQRDTAKKQAQALEADMVAAAGTADRLRRELDALRRRGAACHATAADGSTGEPGADPIGLLIDVLEGVESAGREVAQYADRLKIAGLACEGAYSALSGGSMP